MVTLWLMLPELAAGVGALVNGPWTLTFSVEPKPEPFTVTLDERLGVPLRLTLGEALLTVSVSVARRDDVPPLAVRIDPEMPVVQGRAEMLNVAVPEPLAVAVVPPNPLKVTVSLGRKPLAVRVKADAWVAGLGLAVSD